MTLPYYTENILFFNLYVYVCGVCMCERQRGRKKGREIERWVVVRGGTHDLSPHMDMEIELHSPSLCGKHILSYLTSQRLFQLLHDSSMNQALCQPVTMLVSIVRKLTV